jgi:uncharacterized lipoprotein YmbA
MMQRLPRRAFIPVLLLASCASPSTALYTLEVPAGAVRRSEARVIELRGIGLARYLERSQIVRASENYRVDVLPNDWWAEPLDAMIGRVLARGLAQRLPGATVFVENGAISAEPDATVQVNVQRLDQDANRAMRLIAQFSVMRRARPGRGDECRDRPTGGSYRGGAGGWLTRRERTASSRSITSEAASSCWWCCIIRSWRTAGTDISTRGIICCPARRSWIVRNGWVST